ncbi:MAG: DUF3368 domain-containing protein [Myxacorys chilensis ATA2-1-KO14]|jgi:predicted nucleic acid-binding protein|nr:DUF3368 domain-containing protein [Myxacorys chilensis ATA2-1-KO14]
MANPSRLVINTGPIIALTVALGDLRVLQQLYEDVLVPFEVCQEIQVGGSDGFAISEFEAATWLTKQRSPLEILPFLANSLDRGEAAVIQLALNESIQTVCIDEAAGRRIAQLSGLLLTGSIGILLKAYQQKYQFSMQEAIQRMQDRGIRLSPTVINFALEQASKEQNTEE